MIKEQLKHMKLNIDNILKKYIATESAYEEIIYKAMEYSLFAGGKRLRPILLLETCKMLNGHEEKATPFAVAIEMIHTYSLIHDDLPAMDDDDYRRGKLTNHKVYGEAIAILAGDGLLNLAYEMMLDKCLQDVDENLIRASKVIANAAGVKGMIGGQVVDIISENKKIDIDQLTYIHSHKTAALISSAVVAGALLAPATEEQIEKIRDYGYALGMAFQIQDDILDVIADEKELGKPINSDNKNRKVTYVTLKGLDQAKKMVEHYSSKALESLDAFENNKFLKDLTQFLIDRSY